LQIISTDNDEESFEEMPSDRLNMAVQIRGGPDKHKISAWVLVCQKLNFFILLFNIEEF